VIERESGAYPVPVREFISTGCNHCDSPACIASCPEDAISKRAADGIVLIDQDKCIGCRYCTFACPYGAPRIDSSTGKVSKCTMCVHRIDAGLNPACSDACLTGALQYQGDFTGSTTSKPSGFVDPSLTGPNIDFVLMD